MQPTPASNTQPEDAASTALMLAEQQMNALAHPGEAITLISEALNYISTEGNDPAAMEAVQGGVQQLIETVAALDQAFKSAMVAARTIKDQRQAALDNLTELKKAIKNQDRRVPEIDDLLDDVYQEANKNAFEETADIFQEDLIEDIFQSTGMDWDEVCALLDILQGAHELSPKDKAWAELKDWIHHVEPGGVMTHVNKFDDDSDYIE